MRIQEANQRLEIMRAEAVGSLTRGEVWYMGHPTPLLHTPMPLPSRCPQSAQAKDIEAALREQRRETFEALYSKYQSHLENMVVRPEGV